MTDLVSRVYKPDPSMCCEACVFGRGEHSEFCAVTGLQPLGPIPADCDFCAPGECGEFEAIGYVGGRSICAKCFAKLPLGTAVKVERRASEADREYQHKLIGMRMCSGFR